MKSPWEVRKGQLYFEECKAEDLAEEYGTPLYLMSESSMLERINEIKEKFLDKYPGVQALFASKAYQTLDMCRMISQSPLGMDVVSGGELYTALKAGVDPATIYFHGNAKTDSELEQAVDAGVGRIVVDNLDELESLERIAALKGKTLSILYRITPGVDSHTHSYISTARIDSKFGIPLHEETRDMYIRKALESSHLKLKGFHFHVGSQLMENNSHLMALKILIDLMQDLKVKMGFETEEVNLGGGFGVRYTSHDNPEPLENFTDALMTTLQSECANKNIKIPRVTIEPGRWITAEAGITLYRICSVKEIPGIKTWVAVDGGMGDNIRPALYQADYEAVLVNRADREGNTKCSIAGRYCESSDILIHDATLSDPVKGDILALFTTGAYNFSMASNYNRMRKPAVVLVRGKEHRLSVKRETFEDLIARDI
jgi:diaminopimelate decarboxylase